jgi:hypothetical protein
VADELARQLRSQASIAAEPLSLAGVPAQIGLVVDGRIVDGRRKVSLEAGCAIRGRAQWWWRRWRRARPVANRWPGAGGKLAPKLAQALAGGLEGEGRGRG